MRMSGNPMIKELEDHKAKEDTIAGSVTNVIAVADDMAPCAFAENPREVIHRIQVKVSWLK